MYQLLGKLMWEFAATQTQTAGDAHEKNTCNHADPCCGYSDIWPPRLHDLMNPMLKNCLAHRREPYVRTDAGNIHLGRLKLQICMGSPRLSAKATQRQRHVFNSWCSPSCTSRRNSLELILATFIWIALSCKFVWVALAWQRKLRSDKNTSFTICVLHHAQVAATKAMLPPINMMQPALSCFSNVFLDAISAPRIHTALTLMDSPS